MDFSTRPFSSLSDSIREIRSFVISARRAFAVCIISDDVAFVLVCETEFTVVHEKKLNDKVRIINDEIFFLGISYLLMYGMPLSLDSN